MGYITNSQGLIENLLPTAPQTCNTGCRGNGLTNPRVQSDRAITILQYGQGGQNGAEVNILARAGKVERRKALRYGEILGKIKRTAHCSGGTFKHGPGLRVTAPHKSRNARLEYPGFLGGNLRTCITQQRTVIKADGRNDAYERRYDIGAVKPASEARFYHSHINPSVGKPLESHAGSNFKKRQSLPVVPLQKITNLRFGYHLCPRQRLENLDPLPEIHQMRRRIKPGP